MRGRGGFGARGGMQQLKGKPREKALLRTNLVKVE